MTKKLSLVALILAIAMLLASCAGNDGGKGSGEATDSNGGSIVTVDPAATEETVTAAPTAAPTDVPTEDPSVTPKPKVMNVVLAKKATANYSEGNLKPEYAIDGDESTRWSGFDLGLPNYQTDFVHWLKIDLEGTFVLTEFSVSWETITGYFIIQTSLTGNDDDWNDVYVYDDPTYSASALVCDDTISGSPTASFVRIMTQVPEDYEYANYPYCSIYELEIYGYAAPEGETDI